LTVTAAAARSTVHYHSTSLSRLQVSHIAIHSTAFLLCLHVHKPINFFSAVSLTLSSQRVFSSFFHCLLHFQLLPSVLQILGFNGWRSVRCAGFWSSTTYKKNWQTLENGASATCKANASRSLIQFWQWKGCWKVINRVVTLPHTDSHQIYKNVPRKSQIHSLSKWQPQHSQKRRETILYAA
jgi:hypothetical protein